MLDQIKKTYQENSEVVFKMYGVEYKIEDKNNQVVIYQIHNQQRIKTYTSIEELLNSYTIYGETIKDNEKYIEKILKEEEQVI